MKVTKSAEIKPRTSETKVLYVGGSRYNIVSADGTRVDAPQHTAQPASISQMKL